MAQNHDLELALTAAACEQTNETAEEPVQQTGQQDAQSEPLRAITTSTAVPAESSFFTTHLDGRIEPGRVFDRVTKLDGVPDGYRAMNDREAIKFMIEF